MSSNVAGPEIERLIQLLARLPGLGVKPEHIRVVVPLKKHHAENAAVLREEIAYEGVSVIIARRECIQITKKG